MHEGAHAPVSGQPLEEIKRKPWLLFIDIRDMAEKMCSQKQPVHMGPISLTSNYSSENRRVVKEEII